MRSALFIAQRLAALMPLAATSVVACGDSSGDDGNVAGTAGGAAGAATAGAGGAGAAGRMPGAGSGGRSGGAGSSSGTASGAAGTGAASGGSSSGETSAGTGGAGASAGSAGTAAAGSATAGSAGNAGNGAAGGGASGGGGRGDASPSEGCGQGDAPPSGRYAIDVEGTEREYIVKVPAGYAADPERPYPLVFAFHGRMYDAESVDTGGPPGSGPYYGIEAEAGGGAIFVAPQARSESWTNSQQADVDYVDAMLERFAGQYCIDERRVFSVGFSMGAIMTITLGCSRPDVFRAIAPMSGSLPNTTMLPNGCAGGPLAYWSSHGLDDGTISPAQGERARDEFVQKNGCEATTRAVEPEGCVTYEGCDPEHPVTFCTFDGEHEPAPFAGAAIWEFLSQF